MLALANRSPCDIIKKMADFQEDGDQKLRGFAHLHLSVATLSITSNLGTVKQHLRTMALNIECCVALHSPVISQHYG